MQSQRKEHIMTVHRPLAAALSAACAVCCLVGGSVAALAQEPAPSDSAVAVLSQTNDGAAVSPQDGDTVTVSTTDQLLAAVQQVNAGDVSVIRIVGDAIADVQAVLTRPVTIESADASNPAVLENVLLRFQITDGAVTVRNLHFRLTAGAAHNDQSIVLQGTSDGSVFENNVFDVASPGNSGQPSAIWVQDSPRNVTVSGNTFNFSNVQYSAYSVGVHIMLNPGSSVEGITISGNTARTEDGSANVGLFCRSYAQSEDAITGVTISGNTVENSWGVAVAGGNAGVSIEGNRFSGTLSQVGIYTQASTDAVIGNRDISISGNTFDGYAQGVQIGANSITDTSSVAIAGNVYEGSGAAVVDLTASGIEDIAPASSTPTMTVSAPTTTPLFPEAADLELVPDAAMRDDPTTATGEDGAQTITFADLLDTWNGAYLAIRYYSETTFTETGTVWVQVADGSVSFPVPSELAGVGCATVAVVDARNTVVILGDADFERPIIDGADNVNVAFGATFDAMSGVTASDNVDDDLTELITVDGSVDTSQPGKYTLQYTVSDRAGNTTVVTRTITVLAKGADPTEPDDSTEPEQPGDTDTLPGTGAATSGIILATAMLALGGVSLHTVRRRMQ